MYTALLHNHSDNSDPVLCRGATIENYVNRAFNLGVHILAITDNNKDVAIDQARKLSGYKTEDLDGRGLLITKGDKELIMLRGTEFHRLQGHVLALGYKGKININKDYDLKGSVRYVKDNGGIIIPAHILNKQVGGLDRDLLLDIIDDVDALETFNAQQINFLGLINASRYNALAKVFAKSVNKPGVAGADAHRYKHMDLAYPTFDDLDTSTGYRLVESIRTSLIEGSYTNKEDLNTQLGFSSWTIFPRLTSPRALWNVTKLVGRLITGSNKYMDQAKEDIEKKEEFKSDHQKRFEEFIDGKDTKD